MAHHGQIIASAEFSCSQSEAIKHTRGLMRHRVGAPPGTRARPAGRFGSLPPPHLCGSTGVGVREPGGPRKRREGTLGSVAFMWHPPRSSVEAGHRRHTPPGRRPCPGPADTVSQPPQGHPPRVSAEFLPLVQGERSRQSDPGKAIFQSPTANTNTAEANFTDFHFEASPLSQNPSAWEISSLETGKNKVF